MIEKRKDKRFVAFLSLLYKKVGSFDLPRRCRTHNVSLGGIGLYGDEEMKVGSRLSFQIKIPNSNTHVSAVGEVVWSAKKTPFCYNSGLKFVSIDERDSARLIDHAYREYSVA